MKEISYGADAAVGVSFGFCSVRVLKKANFSLCSVVADAAGQSCCRVRRLTGGWENSVRVFPGCPFLCLSAWRKCIENIIW